MRPCGWAFEVAFCCCDKTLTRGGGGLLELTGCSSSLRGVRATTGSRNHGGTVCWLPCRLTLAE